MSALRLLTVGLLSCAVVGCGSDEGSDPPELPAALERASAQLEKAGFDVEPQTVEVGVKDSPVLVVTGSSGGGAIVSGEGTLTKFPSQVDGISTNLSTECENGLVFRTQKEFGSEKELTRAVC